MSVALESRDVWQRSLTKYYNTTISFVLETKTQQSMSVTCRFHKLNSAAFCC